MTSDFGEGVSVLISYHYWLLLSGYYYTDSYSYPFLHTSNRPEISYLGHSTRDTYCIFFVVILDSALSEVRIYNRSTSMQL